jgi:hypothetical protein
MHTKGHIATQQHEHKNIIITTTTRTNTVKMNEGWNENFYNHTKRKISVFVPAHTEQSTLLNMIL